MSGLLTFPKGGVHPAGKKQTTEDKEIRNAVIPSELVVPMQQHIGGTAELLVEKDDSLKEGMLIGKSSGFVSAQIHSPVPGKVKEIKKIFLPNGIETDAVVIEVEGEFDRLGKKEASFDWDSLSSKMLQDILLEKGIVGLGGATFPTHVKYSIPKQKNLHTLVINGVECEPYLTSDYRLMLEKTDEILTGIRVVHKILSPSKIFFGIEANKPAAIDKMRDRVRKSDLPIQVVPLKVKYPQGDEKQLLKAIIKKEVPSGGLPLDIGAVVSNVGTIFSIYEAVVLQKPLIERIVTVTGGGVSESANLKVRIGTPLKSILEECGYDPKKTVKVVSGGPMMGFAVCDPEIPVIKGTSGVLALTKKEIRDSKTTPCIQCGKCISACPMGLSPTKLYKLIDHLHYVEALDEGLIDCKECGCCGYICPSRIPLIQAMRLGKQQSKGLKK